MSSRRSMPKVRSGCSTCKIRRVKCDEQKPSCARCIRAGRECKGYPTLEKGGHVPDVGALLNLPIKAYSIPFKVPGSRTDRQLLHFYCSIAAGNLSGFSDRELWTRLILQRCHGQSIIRNAVVTLSSLYLAHMRGEYYFTDLGWSPPAKCLEQVTKCHRQLMAHLGSPNASLEIALICSLFFYTFELLLGNGQQALFHLDQGILLLKRYQADRASRLTPASEELCTHITAQFSRLDLQASRYNSSRAPLLKLVSHPETSGTVSVVPDVFFSPTHAEAVLTKLQNWMMHYIMPHSMRINEPSEHAPLETIYEKDVLLGQLEKYYKSIEQFVNYCQLQDSDWINHALLLRLTSRIFYTALKQGTFSGECANRIEYEECLKNSLSDLKCLLSNFKEPNQFADRRHFTLSSDLISVLSYVSIKTMNRGTLEEALGLLEHTRLPSREGLCDSRAMRAVFRKLRTKLLQNHIRPDDDKSFDKNMESLGVYFFCRPFSFYTIYKELHSEDAELEQWF